MAKKRFRDVKKGKKEPILEQNQQRYIKLSDYFKVVLTDSFMLWMPIVYIVIYLIFRSREGFAQNMFNGWIIILTSLVVVESLFLHFSQNAQTPGMKAYNIKLIFEPTKQKPPLTTIILRQILSKVSFISFLWLIIFFNKNHKNLHDLITSTALVYE